MVGVGPGSTQSPIAYEPATEGTRILESRNGQLTIKVLVEVANISNHSDAALLSSPEHRDRFAEALLDALLSFYRGR